MDPISPHDDFFSIGIRCCIKDQAATMGSLHDVEYKGATQNSVTLKHPDPNPRARLSSTMSILSNSSNNVMEMTSPTKKPSEIICESNDDDNKNSHSRHDSITGYVPTTQVAESVAHQHFGQKPEPQLFRTHSLLDKSEVDFGDIISQDKIDAKTADTEESESGLSTPSLEDALALEVGLSAHEYLEECFYTEVSVLDRDKFNAIPEIVKSDFTITGHLGKGSFSDVFEVVCKASHLRTNLNNPIPSVSGKPEPHERRRSTRGRRSSLSNSINIASLSRPPQNVGHKLVLAMKCLRPQIRSDADQFTIGAEDLSTKQPYWPISVTATLSKCMGVPLVT
mmetsp:Transcript_25326/g.45672  ORF Transcript_25326/g.45672 Transcript_25326/m.45672 type:complete len:338 (+) Transcript_25326:35-1048(+)